MPRQPDLLSHGALQLTPATGRDGPRLWVRRLVIWGDSNNVLRDISLRPGLNIVWSPDGTEQAESTAIHEAMGHGGGKTLLCRLLRYCLGEPRLASEDQRHRIAEAFPEGEVGAEVLVDGKLWSVIRPFAPRRRHLAISGLVLEDALATDAKPSGIDPFLDAVAAAVFPGELASLIPGAKDPRAAWLVALAWLTRDQECRLHHVLDWRSPESDSDSPARALGRAELLEALRIFIQALDPQEQQCRKEIADLETKRRALEQERDHLAWQITRSLSLLSKGLGVTEDRTLPGKMSVAPLAQAAREQVEAAAKLKPELTPTEIDAIRSKRDEAQSALAKLQERQAAIEAKLPEVERIIARIRGEVPGLSYSQHEAANPACPVCEVPIDRALAEGCKLSHKLPDLETIQQRRARAQNDLDSETSNLTALNSERRELLPALALAKQNLERIEARLRAIEGARDAREAQWYTAQRRVDEVTDYDSAIDRHQSAIDELRGLEADIEKLRDRAAGFRDKQAAVFARLTEKFDAIVRELVGPQARGHATLSGRGLDLRVTLGGDRSTAAIESLKIIAFDLAAMALSVEGHALTPEFLVHDSPREADMGGPLYKRLFELAQRLEAFGEQPRFQYIITTTSRPPDELARQPWLRLELKGFPSDERLLRRDL
jgi:predicted  nucleic acid-binding Zn-ribbon protein